MMCNDFSSALARHWEEKDLSDGRRTQEQVGRVKAAYEEFKAFAEFKAEQQPHLNYVGELMKRALNQQPEIVYDPEKARWTIPLPNRLSPYSNEFSKGVFTIKQNDTMTPTETLKDRLNRNVQIAAQLNRDLAAENERHAEEVANFEQRILLNKQQAAEYEAAIVALGGSVSEMNLAALKK